LKESEKIRSIRVKLTDVNDRKRLLVRAKNLKKGGFDKIFLVPDLTRNQLEEDKKLRDELKSLNAAGVTNVKISTGKVICMKNDSDSQKV